MAHYRSVIPALGRRVASNILWTHQRPEIETMDHSEGCSAESSRCGSRGESPIPASQPNWQKPKSGCIDYIEENGLDGHHEHGKGVEMIELVCDHSEAALQDLLGLRLSGSRSAGVYVHSVQEGSIAEKNGQIQSGDQLIQVESICLIGLTPDQAVRVLRSELGLPSNDVVHLIIAHPWAEKSERYPRPVTPSLSIAGIPSSKSESALTSAISLPVGISSSETFSALSSRELAETPPGVVAGTFHRKAPLKPPPTASQSKQHAIGAMKVKRMEADHVILENIDKTTTVTTALINTMPSSISMIDIGSDGSPKKAPGKNGFTKVPTENQANKRKISNNKVANHDPNSIIDRRVNHKDSVRNLPGALVEENAIAIRHRRKTATSTGSSKTTDSVPSRATAMTDLNTMNAIIDDRVSPKFQQMRHWDSEKSLKITPPDTGETSLVIRKPSKKNDLSTLITGVQRKTIHRKETGTSDDLPLVSFDQLHRTSPSPTTNKRTVQSSSSGQSKSSKGSNQSRASQGSQQLSWQCPVCLDGASRIRRTKRKMMSTACGHVFCNSCVEDVVGKYHLCPTCRASIKSMNDVHPIFM